MMNSKIIMKMIIMTSILINKVLFNPNQFPIILFNPNQTPIHTVLISFILFSYYFLIIDWGDWLFYTKKYFNILIKK
jgi:hypothetical protein